MCMDHHLKVLNSRTEFKSSLRVGGIPPKTTLPQCVHNKIKNTKK